MEMLRGLFLFLSSHSSIDLLLSVPAAVDLSFAASAMRTGDLNAGRT